MNLSAVILTKNEEKNIEDCLASLSFADEAILIDDNSTDRTIEIARKLGSKVYERKLSDDFASQRNYALRQVGGQWVLFVDADERVTPELRDEIIQLINNPFIKNSGFSLIRRDFMWGKILKYGESGNIRLVRLARKEAGRWERKIHEVWRIDGEVGNLKNPLLHHPHPTLSEFIGHINLMSDLHAQANMDEGKRSSILRIILWPAGKFVKNYIFRLGFLDGTAGFVAALIMSFHSFLAWSKQWILQRK